MSDSAPSELEKAEKLEAICRELMGAAKAKEDRASAAKIDAACAFDAQRDFVYDDSQLQYLFCTRRAAKSYSGALKAFRLALKYPRCSVLVAGLHRLEVKRIWWDPILKRIDEGVGFGAKFNDTELTCRLPNGSVIYLLGMDANEKEKRKALGQKFPLVIIDEAQDWATDLSALVFHVLKPAVSDYRGSICLLGTPGLVAKGLFYDVTTGKEPGWVLHEWTTYDNVSPSARDPKRTCAQEWSDEIEELKRLKPGIEDTPWFRRNYRREWVVDESALVYRYMKKRNDFSGRLPVYPQGDWHYLLGVDLGYNDPSSFNVGAYHDHDPNLYMLHSSKEPGLDLTAVATRAKALDRQYDFDAWLIDGANKQAVEEMRKRQDCPWKAADKTGKSDFIEIMNAEFITGGIKLGPDCDPLREEYAALIWDPKVLLKGKREEHPACQNHCTDGTLYLWRYAYQYLSQILVPRPAPGSPAALAEQEDEMEQAALRQYEQAQEDDPLQVAW